MKLIPLTAGMRTDNSSGVRGVSWSRRRRRWIAQSQYTNSDGRRQRFSAQFKTKEEAEAALIAFRGEINPKDYAEVSDEDFDHLSGFSWYVNGEGYAATNVQDGSGRWTMLMHREIAGRMGLQIEGREVDHIDNNRLHNQRSNMRLATHSQNQHNRRIRKDSFSGVKCLSWNAEMQLWVGEIKKDKAVAWRKSFGDFEQAKAETQAKILEIHGEFARLR